MAKLHKPGLLVCALLIAGCQPLPQVHDPDFAMLHCADHQARSSMESEWFAATGSTLSGPHSIEEYIDVALAQNPDILAARKRYQAMLDLVPVAGSLPDPMLIVTAAPEPIQTAAGQQELIVTASQKLPLREKRDVRARSADSQAEIARANLAATELKVVASVKQQYFQIYYIQQAIAVTESEQILLGQIRDVADTRYRAGNVSQQDVLRADLEVSRVENELIQLRQQLVSAQARLAQQLHVSSEAELLAMEDIPQGWIPDNLERLQQQALAARPELHAQLAAIERDQNLVDLAQLDYLPDVNLGVSWIDIASSGISPVANGRDAFQLSAGINLPIYTDRLDSSLRSAEAKTVASAREYDALRDATLADVADLFAQVQSTQNLIQLFRDDILPKARQTLEVSSQAYNVGEVDFLQLIDNWRQLLIYEVSFRRLQATLGQRMAQLEQVVGGFGAETSALAEND